MAKAAPQAQEININLIPGKEEPRGSVGSAVNWALTVGRYLIIITEIIAIAIFVLSIKLSSDKQDLKENIQSLTSQVVAQSDFEKEFRTVQNRINEVKRQRAAHFENNVAIKEFLALLPKGLTLESLEITEGIVTFTGSFAKPTQLQTLIFSFSQSDKLVGLDISKLEHPNELSKRFKFTASAIIIQQSFQEESGTN
jgi:hypothetical protein